MPEVPRVLLVGHCVPDAHALRSAVRRAIGQVEGVPISGEAELLAHLDGASLLLVNRVLEGDFPDDSGVALIARLGDRRVPAMLISNFADAQAAAMAAGAREGFGKRDLNTGAAADRLRAALAAAG